MPQPLHAQMSNNEATIARYDIYKDEVSTVGLWHSGGENVHMEQLFEDFPMDVRYETLKRYRLKLKILSLCPGLRI